MAAFLAAAAWPAAVAAPTLGLGASTAPGFRLPVTDSTATEAPATATGPQSVGLAAFAWLEGEWSRATRSGTALERWQLLPGVGLAGEGVAVTSSGEERQFEALLLVQMGADIFYIARPPENPYPTGFRLVSHEGDTAVFENPEHDFPQRIIYQRVSSDSMIVSIEGPDDDGSVQRIDFAFTRR